MYIHWWEKKKSKAKILKRIKKEEKKSKHY
jgi:hypothetical protein